MGGHPPEIATPNHTNSRGGSRLIEAREFLDGFFTEYNNVHRHSGIGWHTAASVHFGTAGAVDDARQATLDAALDAARAAHPERFARRPRPPKIPDQSWINQPQPELQRT